MQPHADILDQRRITGRSVRSIGAAARRHRGSADRLQYQLPAFATGMGLCQHRRRHGCRGQFGKEAIPLPSRAGKINPVANDTESQVPQAPKPEPKKQVKVPDEDAIPLKSRLAKKQPRPEAPQRYRSAEPPRQSGVQPGCASRGFSYLRKAWVWRRRCWRQQRVR